MSLYIFFLQEQLQFLRRFLKDVMNFLPQSLPVIAEWACQAVKSLEITSRKEWPLNGLEFAKNILGTLQVLQNEESAVDFTQFMATLTLSQQRSKPNSPLSQLIKLIASLQDLHQLHKDYRIRIKLSEFMNTDKFAVVSLILDWITFPQEIDPLMQGFLSGYMHKWNLDVDDTLADYMRRLLGSTHYTWHGYIGEAPWEEKVAGLLRYTTNIEQKLAVILEAVKTAPVPW